jgi:hypothetical protein
MRSRVLLCLLSSCATIFGAASASASAQSGIPPIVSQASQVAAMASAGVIVNERHMSVTAVAGPMHFSNTNDALLLLSDGAYRHIHFLHMAENGKVLGSDQVLKKENQNNREFEAGSGFFKQPFDRRYLGDYAYTTTASSDAAQVEVSFNSALHDQQHGAGQMTIDAASGRVTSVEYTPYVFPDRYASNGTVTETFGEALPGLWTIVRIDQTYGGRVLLVSGHGTVTETLDHFHRFTDADAGFDYYRTAMQ